MPRTSILNDHFLILEGSIRILIAAVQIVTFRKAALTKQVARAKHVYIARTNLVSVNHGT